jgi:hypothetical protein
MFLGHAAVTSGYTANGATVICGGIRVSILEQRVRYAAESILENESLTAGLDDTTAKKLLDWGVACAEAIAQETAGLNDDGAEAAISDRLRATRGLMRQVRRWVVNRQEMDTEVGAKLLSEIIAQAATVYQHFVPPDDEQRDVFWSEWLNLADDPPQMIVRLRMFIEGTRGDSTANPGGENDQEVGKFQKI